MDEGVNVVPGDEELSGALAALEGRWSGWDQRRDPNGGRSGSPSNLP